MRNEEAEDDGPPSTTTTVPRHRHGHGSLGILILDFGSFDLDGSLPRGQSIGLFCRSDTTSLLDTPTYDYIGSVGIHIYVRTARSHNT
jgi:hypothetical protein